MDYNCKDIPMRLDIRYQPLDFDIYLSQVIDVPRTSLDEEPYNFQLEIDALKTVDAIIVRTQNEQEKLARLQEQPLKNPIPSTNSSDPNSQANINNNINNNLFPTASTVGIATTPSCPTETPLTPIKTSMTLMIPSSAVNEEPTVANNNNVGTALNQINPKDFEDMHYNPFDHLELQTIDELKELDLVFQATYAEQIASIQQQSNTNESPATTISNTNPPTTRVSKNT